MIHIVYQSRIEGEIVVAKFSELSEAEAYMQNIKEKRPKAFPHHSIRVVEWNWVDSGIEQSL